LGKVEGIREGRGEGKREEGKAGVNGKRRGREWQRGSQWAVADFPYKIASHVQWI
jgi:hypothetical protein